VPKDLAEARKELEQLVLLESVAQGRQERISAFLRRLVSDWNMKPETIAARLKISMESVQSLLAPDDAPSVADRLEISERSVRLLLDDPV
jgi:hypothetical protein